MDQVRKEEKRHPHWNEFKYLLTLMSKNTLTIVGLVLISVLVLTAVFQSFIAPYDPIKLNLMERLQPPSPDHLFGTDDLGRDVFSRVVYGARVSLVMTLSVVILSLVLGSFIGITAGYFGGIYSEIIMRITDIFMAFPSILLAMLIATSLKPSIFNTVLTLVLVDWPEYARVMRSQTLTIMQQEYITSARVLGASRWRIMLRHILPNCGGLLIVQSTINLGITALAVASLGFLGLGVQEPRAEWGSMVSKGRKYFLDAWWFPVFPGFAIALNVLGFNFLGDGLRDILDPRTRH